jgi:hypothetical protein
MIDDEKARIAGTRVDGHREFVMVKTLAGDLFEIVRPNVKGIRSRTDRAGQSDRTRGIGRVRWVATLAFVVLLSQADVTVGL